MSAPNVQAACLVLLTLMALAASLWLAQALFAPMLAALVLGVVCAPFTDRLERLRIPRSAAAFLVLAGLIVGILAGFVLIEPVISDAIRNVPRIWREITVFLDDFRAAFAGIEELQTSVNEALSEGASAGATAAEDEAPVVVPGVMEALAYAPSVAAAILVFAGTLYFFLVARTDAYRRLSALSERATPELFCEAEARVSRYFITITLINAVFGVLVGSVMSVIGLSNPMLWGLAAFLVNFILYLGPAAFAVALAVGGLVQFDGAYSFLPAAVYIVMNMTEGQFVSPSLVGKHMRVNPLLVFVSLAFWLWLWGPIGGVVAIPVLVWVLFLSNRLWGRGAEGAEAPALIRPAGASS